jgi:hypothetical protein
MNHKRFAALIGAWVAVFWGETRIVLADHLLLQDGKMLFNVLLIDNESTSVRALRVLHRSLSYEYNYGHNQIKYLSPGPHHYHIEDIVTTAVIAPARPEMRQIAQQRKWHKHIPPPDTIIVPPAPEPVVIVTPVPTPVPLPIGLVPPSVPLAERVFLQLDQFIKEQDQLAKDIQTSAVKGVLTGNEGKQLRLRWVKAQKQVLEQNFPVKEFRVQDAITQWNKEIKHVEEKGIFSLEKDWAPIAAPEGNN